MTPKLATSVILSFPCVFFFLLLLLDSHPATASTYHISFSPAIYIYDNSNSNPPAPAGTAPALPSSPPASLSSTKGPYNPSPSDPYTLQKPSPSSQIQPAGPTPPPNSAPASSGPPFTILPPSSGPVPYDPATPLTSESTVSCATIGEPWWVCTSTQRCAFDDAGDVACCPVGEFCRGVVNYGAGAGPMQAGRTSGGEKWSGRRWGWVLGGAVGWVVWD